VKHGHLVILNLKNELTDPDQHPGSAGPHQAYPAAAKSASACEGGMMTSTSMNLHFHGLEIPVEIPLTRHEDDVLKTSIQPGARPFQYRFRVPEDQPPGLYWYHPHTHGFTKVQVLGGASGAIIAEGIERTNKAVAGLPERVITSSVELVAPAPAS
jgi:FtsP/CotA-like multicopper oxidase with cupredoxin domain